MGPESSTNSLKNSEQEIYMDHKNDDVVCPVRKSLYVQKRNKILREIKKIKKEVIIL